MLKLIAKKNTFSFVQSIINIWMKKDELGTNVDINRSYEKLIQILICVCEMKSPRVRPVATIDQVIQYTIKYITDGNSLQSLGIQQIVKEKMSVKKGIHTVSITQGAVETLLIQFIYTYILYNPTFDDS